MKQIIAGLVLALAVSAPAAAQGAAGASAYTLTAVYETEAGRISETYECDLRRHNAPAPFCGMKVAVGDYVGVVKLRRFAQAERYDLYVMGDGEEIIGADNDVWEYTGWRRPGLSAEDIKNVVWETSYWGTPGRLTFSFTSPDTAGDDNEHESDDGGVFGWLFGWMGQ